MQFDTSPKVGRLLARAYQTGIETTFAEVAALLDLEEPSTLGRALSVERFTGIYELEFAPDESHGDFNSPRVLRAAKKHIDSGKRIVDLMDAGEGQRVEYKSSMLTSLKDWNMSQSIVEHPNLPGELIKTVAAFLNSDGGDLLVGVSDDGRPSGGIELDMRAKGWNFDTWQLRFGALIQDLFWEGPAILGHIQTTATSVGGKQVFCVSVLERREPCFARKAKGQRFEYFVRQGPQTKSLDLPSFYQNLTGRVGE